MKVCLLCYRGNPYAGGQGIYLYHLARELFGLGHEVEVIVGRPYPRYLGRWARVHKLRNRNLWGVYRGEWLREGRPLGMLAPWNLFEFAATRLRFFPEPLSFSLRALGLLGGLLRGGRFDVIHDIQTLGYGIWAMRAFGLPLVTTVHHPLTVDRRESFARDRTLGERYNTAAFYPVTMQGRVIRRMDRVITASAAGKAEIVREFRVRPERISIVPNGVDLETFRNPGGISRAEASLLFVGNTDDVRKGTRYLLDALERLPPEVTLRIVDDPYPRKTLMPMEVERRGLSGRVTFTGKLSPEALVGEYCRCTLLVQPSLYEGFGLPAAEAMACGAPIVAAGSGAVGEVVTPQAGVLVPPGDGEALAGAIGALLAAPARRRTMGEAGVREAGARFSWPASARGVVEVYRRAVAERTGAAA